MVDLSFKLSGLTFKNPIIVSSCTATHDALHVKKAIDAGASGAVLKTLFGYSGKI